MQKALYFMPDISGFTKFVNNTELEHSIHIISELLELLIDSKTIDLELVEVEGDALFMFTTNIPTYEQLISQTSTMLEAFHTHIRTYEKMRICNCGSCKTTPNLELKFLVHYGDLAFIKVKNFVKPYGSDVIKIHRLLKNQIPVNEYILFTNNTFNLYKDQLDISWIKQHELVDSVNINYFYKTIENFSNNSDPKNEEIETTDLETSTPSFVLDKIIETDIQTVYAYISELKYRKLWDSAIKRVEYDAHKVNRIGTKHNCVLPMGNLKFETLSTTADDSMVYGEKTTDLLFTKNFTYFIKLQELSATKTSLELNLFVEFTTIGTFMKSSILKMLSKSWKKKFKSLQFALE